jgi:hypothetical protein
MTLWGDKPEGLLPENYPNFSFFFVLAGTLWALVTSPLRVFKEARPDFGAGKTKVFSGKNICGKYFCGMKMTLLRVF